MNSNDVSNLVKTMEEIRPLMKNLPIRLQDPSKKQEFIHLFRKYEHESKGFCEYVSELINGSSHFKETNKYSPEIGYESDDGSISLYIQKEILKDLKRKVTFVRHNIIICANSYQSILKKGVLITIDDEQSIRYMQEDQKLVLESKKELEEILHHIIKLAPTSNQLFDTLRLVSLIND
jgi:hypothetical protein